MKTDTYPLAVPSDLMNDLRKAARITGLSMADTMRQSMRLGLPDLVTRLTPGRPKNPKPLTPAESPHSIAAPAPESDAFAVHCVSLPATGS